MAAKYYKRVLSALEQMANDMDSDNAMTATVREFIMDRTYDVRDDEDGMDATPVQRLDETIGDVEGLIRVLQESLDELNQVRKTIKDAQ